MKKNIRRISFLRILLSGTGSKRAELKILFGYTLYTILGALLLCLPFAMKGHVSFIDNIFNATSALSTTGLSPNIVSESYTFFGQFIIIALVQIGGIGFMTLSSFILLVSFHHLNPEAKNLLNITLSRPAGFSLRELIHTIIVFTCIVEITGAVALWRCFSNAGVDNALWQGIFHSVSSFSTAGFSLFSNGLENFRADTAVNIIVSTLCYLGGIGFIVALDVWKKIRYRRSYRITFTSKIILMTTLLLAVSGTAIIYFADPSVQQYGPWERFLVASFQPMAAMTTSGFNTVPVSQLAIPSVMTLMLLMLIGASPSGTGGGLKSTTMPAIYGFLKSKINNTEKVTFFGNTIPDYRVNAALLSFIIYLTLMFFGTFALSFFETQNLTELFFEATSAIGTVGLSRGITPELTTAGKIIVSLLMLIGRVGVLSFGALFLHSAGTRADLREEDLAV